MKEKIIDIVERERLNIISTIKDCEEGITNGIITIPPKRRTYKVGQRVIYGAHK